MFLAVLTLLFNNLLFSETTISLTDFHGGSFSFNLGFDTDFMYGSRGDALRMGGAQSTLDSQISFTSYNPAALSYLNYTTASVGLVPVSIISSNVLYGLAKTVAGDTLKEGTFNEFLKKTVNDQLTSSFESMTKSAGVTTTMDNVDAYFGQTTGLTGFEVMAPFANGQAALAFARENKTSLDLSLMLTGLEATVIVDSSDHITITAQVSALINFRADNIVTSFGVGRKLTPEWGIGIVAEHYDSRFYLNGRGEIDGSATYNSVTKQFNTNENDSLAQKAYADIIGEGWGLRFGTSYHFLNDTLELGADASVQPEITYRGKPDILYHTIPDSIDSVDFTKTQAKTYTGADGTLKLKLPSFARFTFAYKGGVTTVLNYTHYFDSYCLQYKNSTDNIQMYLNMMDSVNLGFNFGIWQIGAGVIYSKLYQKTNGEDKNLVWFPLPMLSTGVVIPFGDYLKWEVDLFVFPLSVLKTAISYSFK